MPTVAEFKGQILTCPLGKLHAAWSSRGLWALTFLEATPTGELALDVPFDRRSEQLTRVVERYFAGGYFSWELDGLDWRGISGFQRRALEACYEIPSGTTCTYSGLASRIGSPKAARAIGAAMARNRWPLLIPCHRVVGSDGRLTGYSGRGGIETKRRLLEMERDLTSVRNG